MDAPPGLRARPATADDVAALNRLFVARALEVIGVADSDEDEMRALLTAPGRALADETLVLEDADGELAAFVDVAFGSEQPAYRHAMVEVGVGLAGGPAHRWGIATALRLGEALEAAAGTSRPTEIGSWADDAPTTALFAELGFTQVRRFDLMARDLEPRPAAPAWPAGIVPRVIDGEADLAAAHATLAEAFADHEGGGFPTLERFVHGLEGTGFAPGLSSVAWAGDRAVGAVITSDVFPESAATGYVNDLGVRREARGCGLGLALLLDTFARMADAGLRRAALHVDSESLTGATRLYARAGMTAVPRYARWARRGT